MTNAKKHVMLAIRYALKPLVRLGLRTGLEFKELTTLLKEVTVEEAINEAKLLRASQAYSRIALMTGVDRKDVKTIKVSLKNNGRREFSIVSKRSHRITRILSAWHQNDLYTDSNGEPLLLRKQSGSPNLVSLIKTFSGDIPANQVISEMIRVKAIERTVRGHFRPLNISYDPLPILDSPEYLVRSANVLNDIGRTVTHNIHRDSEDIGFYEKTVVEYIDPDYFNEFKRFTRDLSNSALKTTNAWLLTRKCKDNKRSLRVGIYLIKGESDDY